MCFYFLFIYLFFYIIKGFLTIVFIFIVISAKRCGNNNKDEDNSPKILNDKNKQASSQKFRQLIVFFFGLNWFNIK